MYGNALAVATGGTLENQKPVHRSAPAVATAPQGKILEIEHCFIENKAYVWKRACIDSSYAQAFQVRREIFEENPSELHTII